ncbi:MAG TPA: HAMP domain-containing sensor histidine kinase [Candidatus Dormibacteraeota bacterium]|nr:HAMP domain-containing sensor histidine kinase [Candidatus Dormibacteraeota bacterium]
MKVVPRVGRVPGLAIALVRQLAAACPGKLGLGRDEVLDLVAHELRAPITVIRGCVSMLAERSASDLSEQEWERSLGVIATKTAELEGLVEMLVTRSLLGRNLLRPSIDAFDVVEAVRDATAGVDARALEEGATIELPLGLPPVLVQADRRQVVRILSNLLNNALTYSVPPARVSVIVRRRIQVEVAVQDRGIGIPPDRQGRIFEAFSRAGGAPDVRGPGLGLGLAIGRRLAELNGGSLDLERSAPGEGSVFVLRLPPAPEEPSPEVTQRPGAERPMRGAPAGPRRPGGRV